MNNQYIFERPFSQSPDAINNYDESGNRPDAQTVTTKVISYKGSSDINYPKASSSGFASPDPQMSSPKKTLFVDDHNDMRFRHQRAGQEDEVDDLQTDRRNLFELDSERKLRDDIKAEQQAIELRSFPRDITNSGGRSYKKSLDTRATDFRDGIVVPGVESDDDEYDEEGIDSDEDDQLIGERDSSMVAHGRGKGKRKKKISREVLIKMRRQ